MTLPARAGGKAVTVLQLLTLVACIVRSPHVRSIAWATTAVGLHAIWDYGRAAARGTRSADRGTGCGGWGGRCIGPGRAPPPPWAAVVSPPPGSRARTRP